MNIGFKGAYILGTLSYVDKDYQSKKKKLIKDADEKGKNLVKDEKARCFISYLHHPAEGQPVQVAQVSSVLLTDDDADPLLQHQQFDVYNAQDYSKKSEWDEPAELRNKIWEFKDKITEYSFNLFKILEDHGFFKASTRGDKLPD